jgi:hypothetical protein
VVVKEIGYVQKSMLKFGGKGVTRIEKELVSEMIEKEGVQVQYKYLEHHYYVMVAFA